MPKTTKSNGVCGFKDFRTEKNGRKFIDRKRDHSMITKIDGNGNPITSCEKCGALEMRTQHTSLHNE